MFIKTFHNIKRKVRKISSKFTNLFEFLEFPWKCSRKFVSRFAIEMVGGPWLKVLIPKLGISGVEISKFSKVVRDSRYSAEIRIRAKEYQEVWKEGQNDKIVH